MTRWVVDATPTVLPLCFDFIQAISSLTSCGSRSFLVTSTYGLLVSKENWRKIRETIIVERVNCANANVPARRTEAERVTIRGGARCSAYSDCAIRARDILHDDRLIQSTPHALSNDACNRVCRPARQERHDHHDGPRWICLCSQRPRGCGQRSAACNQMQESSAWKFHDRPQMRAGLARERRYTTIPRTRRGRTLVGRPRAHRRTRRSRSRPGPGRASDRGAAKDKHRHPGRHGRPS